MYTTRTHEKTKINAKSPLPLPPSPAIRICRTVRKKGQTKSESEQSNQNHSIFANVREIIYTIRIRNEGAFHFHILQ